MTFLSPLKPTDVPQVHGEDGEYLNMTDWRIASHANFTYGDECADERYGIVTADCFRLQNNNYSKIESTISHHVTEVETRSRCNRSSEAEAEAANNRRGDLRFT